MAAQEVSSGADLLARPDAPGAQLAVATAPPALVTPPAREVAATMPTTTPAEGERATVSAGPQQSFRAAVLALLPILPFVATVVTILIYVAPLDPSVGAWVWWLKSNPLLVGTGVSLLGWMVTALLYSRVFHLTSADQANSNSYGQLFQRLKELDARLDLCKSQTGLTPSEQGALERAASLRGLIQAELDRPSAGWVLGTAYINAWTMMHRAEETLLLIEPVEDVVSAALYDELRLQDSQIDSKDQLLAKLRLAVTRLAPEAAIYLSQQPPTSIPPAESASPPLIAQSARVALRDVRQTINEFRDSSWDALVRTRNHALGTLFASGYVTYLLLALAITVRSSDGPPNLFTDAVAAAATFYLVGATVGLFNRLYADSQNDNSVEDYGLSMARLSLTPVLSGLAAMGGVVVIAMLPAALSGEILTPAAAVITPAPAAAPTAVAVTPSPTQPNAVSKHAPALHEIFNLSSNPLGIILAAVFGLSPALLVGALRSAGERYRSGLQSTATSQGRT
jgi:hypothetical protein